jgi:hypothetical protein
VPWGAYPLRLSAFITDYPAAVISENEFSFLAYGTKIFTAVR